MPRSAVALLCLLSALPLCAEEVARVDFESWKDPLPRTYGDSPRELVNAVEANAGRSGAALHLKLQYPEQTPAGLTYYTLNLPAPVPIDRGVRRAR